jgi:NADPH:quinone reductase-like Zn-dependent oxidoreductase
LRENGIHARRLTRTQPTTTPTWTPRDTILITGGTGALGTHTAHWCAQNGASHLILANRNPHHPSPVVRR